MGARLLYEYDFGDGWQHELVLEEVLLGDESFSRHAWQVNDVVRPKTVEGRKDLQSFSKHSRTPITRVTMRPVSGSAILSLNPSLQMKLTDDYAGNTEAHKRPVDERYGLFSTVEEFRWHYCEHGSRETELPRRRLEHCDLASERSVFEAPDFLG